MSQGFHFLLHKVGLIIAAMTISQVPDETPGRPGFIWKHQVLFKSKVSLQPLLQCNFKHPKLPFSICYQLEHPYHYETTYGFTPMSFLETACVLEVGLPFICPETSSFKSKAVPWVQGLGICEQTCFHSACPFHGCLSLLLFLKVCFCSMRPNSFWNKVSSITMINVGSLNPVSTGNPCISSCLVFLNCKTKHLLSNISAQCVPESYLHKHLENWFWWRIYGWGL